jgi:hypothetical protein
MGNRHNSTFRFFPFLIFPLYTGEGKGEIRQMAQFQTWTTPRAKRIMVSAKSAGARAGRRQCLERGRPARSAWSAGVPPASEESAGGTPALRL